ncbi:MAG: hypothetical protein AB1781_05300 [Pseudomonadota bacterium]
MSWFKGAFQIGLLFALAACGFHPLYEKAPGGSGVSVATDELAYIRIEPMPDRLGQEFRNALLDRITPMGEPPQPKYFLRVAASESTQKFGLRADETATRANLRLAVTYVLYDVVTRKVLFHAKKRVVGSYNILRSDFATLAAEKNIRTRLINEASDGIKTSLAIHLNENR